MNERVSKREAEKKYKHNKLILFKNKVLNICARFMLIPGVRVFLYRMMGVTIGDNVFIGLDCYLDDQIPELIKIESGVIIGFRVTITAHDDSDFTAAPVVIKKSAYLGTGAIILQGVCIGERSVIGAGSVVTRDVPPDTVAVGVPAKAIKKRPQI